jgi:hypothetical protein
MMRRRAPPPDVARRHQERSGRGLRDGFSQILMIRRDDDAFRRTTFGALVATVAQAVVAPGPPDASRM